MKSILLISMFLASSVFAKNITDYTLFKYEVFFTNPICKAHAYPNKAYANDGTVLKAKPANVYCKRGDRKVNFPRKSSPNYNLRKLINDTNVNEIFLTYLSFSDSKVANSLCSAIEKRNLKVTFIIDSNNALADRRQRGMAKLDKVSKCRPDPKVLRNGEKANIPKTMTRGNIGGLGYAHNKIIIQSNNN